MAELTWNGKTYTLDPFGLSEHFALKTWLRDNVISEMKKQIVGLPLKLCEHAWDFAKEENKAIEIGSTAYKQHCCTFESLSQVIVIAMQKLEKAFKYEDAVKVLNEDLEKLSRNIMKDLLGYSLTEK